MKAAGLFLLLCLTLLSFSTAKGEGRIIYIVPPGSPGVNSALPHDTWLNAATNHGGGIALVSGYIGPYEVRNSIVYFNTSSSEATKDLRNTGTPEPAPYYHCCTSSNFPVGMNITNNPLFVKAEDNDFRLSMGSLCINAGTNMPWMETAADLDDRIRIRYEAVDIGCYEYIYPGTTVFFQ